MWPTVGRSIFGFAESSPVVVPVGRDALRARATKVVTKGETLDYRTMLPEPGGLFDPKLFGPATVIDGPWPPTGPRKTWFARIELPVPIVNPLVLAHATDAIAGATAWTAARVEAASSGVATARELVTALDEATLGDAVLHDIPVLPPDLRPLARDDKDRWAATPINRSYSSLVTRAARLATADDAQYAAFVAGVRALFDELRGLCDLERGLAADAETNDRWLAEQVLLATGFVVG